MSDTGSTIYIEGNGLLFILFPLAILCCLYCFRNEAPENDPADDAIGGWIPNPSSPTESLEERRSFIENNLIIKKVVEAERVSKRNVTSPSDNTSSSESSTRSLVDVVTKSDRTISSYASALLSMGSSGRKLTKFSEPESSSGRSEGQLAVHVEKEDEDDDEENQQQGQEEKRPDKDDTNAQQETTTTPPAPSCRGIKHRRKADIIARSLSRSLRGKQDYNQPTSCDICLLDYEVGEEVAWSNNDDCIHAFHKECITDWLLRGGDNPKCPNCRRDYVVVREE